MTDSSLRRVVHAPVLRTGARVLRPARRTSRLLREEQVILGSGVFDKTWYEAQCGETFANQRAAIRHYLRSPRTLGYSPNPFFEAESFDDERNTRTADPLVEYLTNRRRRATTSPHPYLDFARLRDQLAETGATSETKEGLGPWQAWVRQAEPDTIVPVPEGLPPATVGTIKSELLRASREWRARTDLATPHSRIDAFTPAAGSQPSTRAPGDRPRVSVVIATWNRSHSMRDAIASVQAQTLDDVEVIVVDDGSDDDTAAVMAGITHYDDRVRYLPQERGGVCRARNAGLAVARGDYVAFLDSDNTWRPDFLAAMVAAMDQERWDVAHAALQMSRDERLTYRASEGSRESLLLGNYIDLNVLLVRRPLLLEIGGFDESLRRAVDYDLILRLTEHSEPHLVKVIGADYSDDADDHSRISNSEPYTWNQVVQNRHLLDWQEIEQRPRVPGRVSVVVPIAVDLTAMVGWFDLVRPARSGDHQAQPVDLELVLVGTRTRAQYCVLTAFAQDLPVTLILRNPRSRIPLLSNLGLAATTGEYVVLCRPSAKVKPEDLPPLVTALRDPAVAVAHPLVERRNMTVASAGGVFGPGSFHPHPLLAAFPVSDALPLDGSDLPAALSPIVALRAADLIALRGLEPLFGNSLAETDLSLRARERGLGVTRLVTDSRPVARSERRHGFLEDMAESTRILAERWESAPGGSQQLWARAGFDFVEYRPFELTGTEHRSEKTWGLRPDPHRRAVEVHEGVPSLRWTIDISAPAGPRGEQWGDRHFAAALARALERRGQRVAVDHREARDRATRAHDDVLLVLRGLDEVHPTPGPVKLLWVISHPELVTGWEAARYDAVFAASTSWALQTEARWGLPVSPLLQCTDPELFNPSRGRPDRGPTMLFVGNARKVFRPIVQYALATGVELAVYGRGWEPFVDARLVAGLHVSNTKLGARYGSAGLVLNDHWDDMRRAGFLSNRLFDAVACAARVVSDDAPGIAETFGDSVAVVRSAAELDELLRAPYSSRFPDRETRVRRAEHIHAAHSFDARADQLLTEAIRRRAAAPSGDGTATRRDPSRTVRRW